MGAQYDQRVPALHLIFTIGQSCSQVSLLYLVTINRIYLQSSFAPLFLFFLFPFNFMFYCINYSTINTITSQNHILI